MIGLPFLGAFLKQAGHKQLLANFVDHLNYRITSCVLGFFALLIAGKQFLGNPIQCWTPPEYKESWVNYAHDYCFAASSYYIPFEEDIPMSQQSYEREDHVSYYRWIHIVLAIQAICFYLPNYFWTNVHKETSINPEKLVEKADKIDSIDNSNDKKKALEEMAGQLWETVESFGQTENKTGKLQPTPRNGYNASMLYILTKLFYLLNVLGQLYALNVFLGGTYLSWGYQTALDVYFGFPIQNSGLFPKVVMCDFKIRKLANIQNQTMQCIMMLNVLNEKIYFGVFFWFLFLAIMNSLNFLCQFLYMCSGYLRTRAIRQKVNYFKTTVTDPVMFSSFTTTLRADGFLLLNFVTRHLSKSSSTILVNALLEKYAAAKNEELRNVYPDVVNELVKIV